MGEAYDVNRITDADGTINMTAFKEYSPLYLSCVPESLLYLWTMLIPNVFVIAWHSLCNMRFLLLLLLQPSPTPYYTSGNLLSCILAGRWKNSPILMLGWCRDINKVSLSLYPNLRALRLVNIVPEWWYACIFSISLSFQTPWCTRWLALHSPYIYICLYMRGNMAHRDANMGSFHCSSDRWCYIFTHVIHWLIQFCSFPLRCADRLVPSVVLDELG